MSDPNTANDRQPLRFNISLSVIEDLGEKLYSNVPAVLSEVVANSWDADAQLVKVSVEREDDQIIIEDDGQGMTRQDVIERFLTTGYHRREPENEGPVTPGGRHVMGRKGIGKLSVFSIAQFVEVHTAKKGQKTAFILDREAIKREVKKAKEEGREENYEPTEYDQDETKEIVDFERGTRIILYNLDKRLIRTEKDLRRRIARRFSIIGRQDGFRVEIDGMPVSASDRDYYRKLEFLWYIKTSDREVTKRAGKLKRPPIILDGIECIDPETGEKYHVEGWIGTVSKPSNIDDINTAVTVFAHGKLIQENILRDVQEGRVFSEYVVGEIYADFVDADDRPDIATSNRQNIKQTDPRYEALTSFVKKILNVVALQWDNLRDEEGTRRALDIPPVKEWYDRLISEQKPYAKSLFSKIERLKFRDERTRLELYRASLLAFEKLALNDAVEKLERLRFDNEEDFAILRELFANIDEFEATQYYQIARGRLSVIDELDRADNAGGPLARQRVVQRVVREHIFDHLWLLDRSWDAIASESEIDEIVDDLFADIQRNSDKGEDQTRIEIKYRRVSGYDVIIDLREYDAKLGFNDLMAQLRPYIHGLEEVIADKYPRKTGSVQLVCVTGWPVLDADERERDAMARMGIRSTTYDALIEESKRGYRQYLSKRAKVSDLIQIIDKIDQVIEQEILEHAA